MARILVTARLKAGLFDHDIEFGTATKALSWLNRSKNQEFEHIRMVDKHTNADYHNTDDIREYLAGITGLPAGYIESSIVDTK